MTRTEESRLQLHRKLAGFLDEETATELMVSLPPFEWTDVATKQDLADLRAWASDRFDMVEARVERLDARFDALGTRFEVVDTRLQTLETRTEGMVTKAELYRALHRHLVVLFTATTALLGSAIAAMATVAR